MRGKEPLEMKVVVVAVVEKDFRGKCGVVLGLEWEVESPGPVVEGGGRSCAAGAGAGKGPPAGDGSGSVEDWRTLIDFPAGLANPNEGSRSVKFLMHPDRRAEGFAEERAAGEE